MRVGKRTGWRVISGDGVNASVIFRTRRQAEDHMAWLDWADVRVQAVRVA